MGFAFYEMSGGKNFVPRKADKVAAAKAAEEEKSQAREARLAYVQPEPVAVPVTAAKAPADVVAGTISEPEPVAQTTPEPVENTGPVTLASLQDNSAMFARPVIQLGTIPNAVALPDAEPDPQPLDIREVAGARVNVRMGPGTGYDIVTSLSKGTTVEVIETDSSGWVKLRTVENEFVGWMAEYLLTAPTG